MIARIFQGLTWFVVAGLIVEFYLAGAALFGVTSFQGHRALGVGLAVAVLFLLVVGLIARPGRRVVGLSAVLTALTIVQILLPSLRGGLPWLSALHVVNALALAVVALSIALVARQSREMKDSRGELLAAAETG